MLVPSVMAALVHVMWLGLTVPPGDDQRMLPAPDPKAGFVQVTAMPIANALKVPPATVTAELPVSPWLQLKVPRSVIRAFLGVEVSFCEKVTFPAAAHCTEPAPTTVVVTAPTCEIGSAAAPAARPVTMATIATRRDSNARMVPPWVLPESADRNG